MQKKQQLHSLQAVYTRVTKSLYFPPVVVLVAILIITIWPWQNARQSLKNNAQQARNEQVNTIESKITERFLTYSNSLQSGVALLQADPNIDREQWRTFFTSTEQSTDRSGIQGTGFTKVFSATEAPTVIAAMTSQGVTDFTIKPMQLDPDLNSAVLYLYPETDNNKSVRGFNMLSEPTRREAMLRARDSSEPSLTRAVTLVQDTKVGNGKGFLLYVPYYTANTTNMSVEERRIHLEGYVYGGFRASSLFQTLLEEPSRQANYSLRVYDGEVSEKDLLYETTNTKYIEGRASTQQVVQPINVYGTKWNFVFTFDNFYLVSRSEKNAPLYILLVGVVTAFLVFLALLTIFKSRARELQQQKDTEVNLAKDELLSLASHQMRTPATGVKQYLGMVLQGFAGAVTKDQKQLLNKAYTSNERQLQVINQILHLAKLETGRIVLAKRITNLNELVRDVVEELHDEVQLRKHALKLKIPKQDITAKVDSHMIRMALENLLTNALKYTVEPGTITVKLSKSKNAILISIKDTGIGIEDKDATEIFKRFTRLYDVQTEKISGTGIGLYLADQLVKLHKGTITVRSTAGKGSEFTLVLPSKEPKKQ